MHNIIATAPYNLVHATPCKLISTNVYCLLMIIPFRYIDAMQIIPLSVSFCIIFKLQYMCHSLYMCSIILSCLVHNFSFESLVWLLTTSTVLQLLSNMIEMLQLLLQLRTKTTIELRIR